MVPDVYNLLNSGQGKARSSKNLSLLCLNQISLLHGKINFDNLFGHLKRNIRSRKMISFKVVGVSTPAHPL